MSSSGQATPAGTVPRVKPVLSLVTVDDLPEVTAGDQEAFLEDYDLAEPEPRLPLSERLQIQIKRYKTLIDPINASKLQYIQARNPENGELMGAAIWHTPGTDRLCMRPNPEKEGVVGMGEKGSGWEGVDLGIWDGFLGDFDNGRKRHLGDTPHWYLGPIYVLPKYHRQGIASSLIQYQIQRNPNDVMYLDARIGIYKTYEKQGFEIVQGGKFYRMVRWPDGMRPDGFEAIDGETGRRV